MLQNISGLTGCTITATDGDVGTITDLLFDDATWTVRWLVIDTGTWAASRKVLLPPSVMGHPDEATHSFRVRLTRAEIEASPTAETHLPVSRQYEADLYDHYRWNPYWGASGIMSGYGGMAAPMMITNPDTTDRHETYRNDAPKPPTEPHLRSADEVTGYHIHTSDGELGHLSDILMQDADWTLRYLVIDTSNWWMGKKVLLSPRAATSIDWEQRLIHVNVTRAQVKTSPDYDPTQSVDRAMEDNIATNYATRTSIPPH